MFRGHKVTAFFVVAGALVVLFVSYLMFAMEHSLDHEEVHMLYVAIFLGLGILFTIVLPATCLTSEKESRSLPLLLSTTLSDWHIIIGKFVGLLRRCFPIWLFLFGHLTLFTLAGVIHPIAIVQIAILVAGVVILLSCSGLYFSSRFRHTTTAVIMNFALPAAIWGLVPLLLFFTLHLINGHHELFELYINTHPFFQALIVMDATTNGWARLSRYYWCEFRLDAIGSTFFMMAMAGGYMLVGWFFLRRAKARLRRNIF